MILCYNVRVTENVWQHIKQYNIIKPCDVRVVLENGGED